MKRCISFPRKLPVLLLGAAFSLVALTAGRPADAIAWERSYPVSRIVIEYALDHPRHIPLADLLDLEVGLRADEGVYVAPRPVDRTVRMRLSSLPRDAKFSASALLHINQHIVSTFNRAGWNGVLVAVPDIEENSGRDLRAPGDTRLRLRIWTGRVSSVASIADGDRFGGLSVDERSNHAAHAWIRARSPVRPGGARGLLSARALDDFAAEMSRHPGRRIEAELEPGPVAGTTAVTLRVTENKPWTAYAQVSNTGTPSTTRLRERFGFTHNQLLGRDDILQLDYSTGDFDSVHALVGSYSAPFLLEHPEWRYRLHGLYSEFDAREAGFTNAGVEGEEVSAGAEVSRQLMQRGLLFVDAALGARWQHMRIENRIVGIDLSADTDYVVPHADVRVVRDSSTSSFRASFGVKAGFTDTRDSDPVLAGVSGAPELDVLGTPDADDDFALASADLRLAFYLEPLLAPRAWSDPSTPASSTLAHEVALHARGQWALGHRLIPQFREVAGGFDSVRGYDQSAVVGDNLVLASAEYRLHVPRLFRPDESPPQLPGIGSFRTRPPHVYGSPDWDLVLRVFSDAARVEASHALSFEPDETLWSVGAGVELQVLRNLLLRADFGTALIDLERAPGDRGEIRSHFAATVLY